MASEDRTDPHYVDHTGPHGVCLGMKTILYCTCFDPELVIQPGVIRLYKGRLDIETPGSFTERCSCCQGAPPLDH